MPLSPEQITRFLKSVHPYDALPLTELERIAPQLDAWEVEQDFSVYDLNETLPGLFIIYEGQIEVADENGVVVSHLGLRNSFGERGLLRDGKAVTSARADAHSILLIVPPALFRELMDAHEVVAKFFDRSRGARPQQETLATSAVETLMARNPATCAATDTVQNAAQLMRERGISSLCVTEDELLQGILTTRDLSGKVVGGGLPYTTPVAEIMTGSPLTLSPSAIGSDVLHAMMEHHIGHIPITDAGRLVGIVTQTDLTRFQAVSSAELVSAIARADTAQEMAKVTAEIPRLLVQLVAGGNRHEVVTRLITDIADTVTGVCSIWLNRNSDRPRSPIFGWPAAARVGRNRQVSRIRTTASFSMIP